MKKFLLTLLQDKNGQYSIREMTVCTLLVALIVSWIIQQLFNKSVPEFMFFTIGGLIAAGLLGYSLEKSLPPQTQVNRNRNKFISHLKKNRMKKITEITQTPIVKRMFGVARTLFFLLGVLTTLSTTQFFKSCNKGVHEEVVVGTDTPSNDELKEQKKIISNYNRRIANLSTQNSTLEKQVLEARNALSRSIKSNTNLQKQLHQRIEDNAILTDTEERLTNCDSLASLTSDLVVSCMEKDSLYNSLTSALTEQVAIKDSTITAQDQRYNYLQLNYDRNLVQQQILLTDNLDLKKQVKQHRARSKLLSTCLLILGGTVTYMVVRH
ncbi:hypothetical protein [Chitinophaga sp. S165]|uniref:hypothetical protein n=1 Tax=Chitinophaga sp. S165 TaxID=2135462 RepID=UPI000D7158DA|nr:hypothetical protein [Chitinophaga sp. S165]PWV45926.1 hypothetical protein C7475_112144 [Chitinophaga sp. S165]